MIRGVIVLRVHEVLQSGSNPNSKLNFSAIFYPYACSLFRPAIVLSDSLDTPGTTSGAGEGAGTAAEGAGATFEFDRPLAAAAARSFARRLRRKIFFRFRTARRYLTSSP